MVKLEKGSKEAMAWASKMKKAREAKKSMKGGYLQPGEVPLSSTNEGLVAEKELYAPREMKSSEFMIDEEGGAMCKTCRMCGGAMLSNPDNQYVPPLQSRLQKSRFDSGEVLGGKMLRTKSGLRKKKQLQIVPGSRQVLI